MKIKGKVSLIFDVERGLTIELEDRIANTRFARVTIKAEDVIQAFCQRADIDCIMEIEHLDRIGKKHKHIKLEFPMPLKGVSYSNRKEVAIAECQKYLPKGWIADKGYSSQDSFFIKDGVEWASTIIRKYKKIKQKE